MSTNLEENKDTEHLLVHIYKLSQMTLYDILFLNNPISRIFRFSYPIWESADILIKTYWENKSPGLIFTCKKKRKRKENPMAYTPGSVL